MEQGSLEPSGIIYKGPWLQAINTGNNMESLQ